MISIKRYLNAQTSGEDGDPLSAMQAAYRSALTAMGACAVRACPSVSHHLQSRLTKLERQLGRPMEAEVVAKTAALVDIELEQWGKRAQTDLEQKTNDVKELLVVLARTAATIGASDGRHAKRFDEFTARLQRIGNLEDLTQIRQSLVKSASELKAFVEQMSQETRQSVAQLQAEVVTYQAKLEHVEELASRDILTGLFNRGRVIDQIEERIAAGKPFSVALIDLNGFKQVNDRFGHAAGDDLLKQFSAELQSHARAGAFVGRWGGDEFILVLDCAGAESRGQLARIEKWLVGDYLVESPSGRQRVQVNASIGLEEWRPHMTVRDLIDRADAAMYKCKATRGSMAKPGSAV